MNLIQETVIHAWKSGRRTRNAAKGWCSGNAVCCPHNGETTDRRNRGGVLLDTDGSVVYSCFNCAFKTGWKPGRPLSFKLKELLDWLGVSEGKIQSLVFEALRLREHMIQTEEIAPEAVEISFTPKKLPEEARPIGEYLDNPEVAPVCEYLFDRGFTFNEIAEDFWWTPETAKRAHKRAILPFYWKNKIIGYTSRAIAENSALKYINQFEPNYVYNTDNQPIENKYVIVVEGPIDAKFINGVAICSNSVSDEQAEIIEHLGKEVIVCPDQNQAGDNLVRAALKYGWSVAFPEWDDGIEDINDAVKAHGRIYTLQSIFRTKEHNPLRIQLLSKITAE